jgi:hypothetical protein
MKKIILGLTLLFSVAVGAQALTPSTGYKAYVETTNDSNISFDFRVSATGNVYQAGSDGKLRDFSKEVTINNAATTTYTWLNAGGIWSESQTFIFTKDKTSGKLTLNYLRVVQNEGSEPWIVYGVGEVDVK